MAYRRLEEGDRVGEYVLERRTARSDASETWVARHHLLQRPVRVVAAVDGKALPGMRRTGMTQHRLDHHGVVRTLGMNLDHDPPYVLLEHVEGTTLRALLAGHSPLAWPEARPVLRGVLEGLAHAHERGEVHGDLRPENVLLDEDGAPHLTGFGGREEADAGEDDLLSDSLAEEEAEAVREAAYLPRDPLPPTPSFDVFSAGAILFELVTGGLPAGSERPSDVADGLPPEVDALFRKAYTSINLRYPNASAMLADLGSVSGRPETADEPESAAGIRILRSHKRCAKCGAENRMEFDFCTVCGSVFDEAEPRRCRVCSKPLLPDARFCTFCGKRQDA